MRIYPAGTILFAKSGMSCTKGLVYCLRQPSAVVNHLAAVECGPSIDPGFLVHWLRANPPTNLIENAAYPSIKISAVRSMAVPVLPLPEQKRIAAILDAAETLRAKRRESIQYLDALIQSTFIDMFGDPVTNPMGWEVKPLGQLADNEDGQRVPVKKSDREAMHGEFPYYGASGVIDWVDGYLFEGDRLLIGEDGANLVARSTPIAFIASGKFWVNNHAHVLAYNGSAVLEYLETFINFIDVKPYLSGTAQPKLNQQKLNSIPVPCPPLGKQMLFLGALSRISKISDRLRQHASALEELSASLSFRAFVGEL
jgi:type I restriction enzyme S subunit